MAKLFSRTKLNQSTISSSNNPISVEQINARVASLNLGLRLVASESSIVVHSDIASMPQAVQDEATKQGASSSFVGVFYAGDKNVHLLAPKITSVLELEEVIMHELEGHFWRGLHSAI
jgi:hypothetical protein